MKKQAEVEGWKIDGKKFKSKKDYIPPPAPGPKRAVILQIINQIRQLHNQSQLQSVLNVSPLDCYLLLMEEVINHIVSETNKQNDKFKLTYSDISAYIGVRIAQQLSPSHAIDDAWATFKYSRGMWGNRWIAKTMLKDEYKFIHSNKS